MGREPRPLTMRRFSSLNRLLSRGAATGNRFTMTPPMVDRPGSYAFAQSMYDSAHVVATST